MKAPLRVKRFFRFCLTFLHHSHLPSDTLRLSGAEDKALRGRNLSADSGARPEPAGNTSRWFLFHPHLGWPASVKSWTAGGEPPARPVVDSPPVEQLRCFVHKLRAGGFVREPCIRLRLLHEHLRLGCPIQGRQGE